MSLEHFGDGIRVFASSPGASNLSVITSGSSALLVDAGSLPSAAREFWRQATDGANAQLVLTHHHADHVFGAAGLADVPVIASDRAARLLDERGVHERDRLIELLPDHRDELASAAVPVVTQPVDSTTTIDVDGRAVRLIPVGHAHTPGDVVVFDQRTSTVFTGDVVFTNVMPVLRDANTAGWIEALAVLEGLKPERVVPGHGTAGSAGVLDDMIELLSALRSIAERHADDDDPTASIAELPTRFRDLRRMERFEGAVSSIVAELRNSPSTLSPRRSE
ncbi:MULTISPECIES: MBL fold metallo-hydrolase [unclassified Cryobacterium]|uniref:MBL fold metallo-hydrolase n=1 Tax=unclassified Cryobacterium TaxID=2649013 RepID=UPI001444BADD|nr:MULTISPECIES: MBL fold metallo-hydrolase [unclassified Cryobacterium]